MQKLKISLPEIWDGLFKIADGRDYGQILYVRSCLIRFLESFEYPIRYLMLEVESLGEVGRLNMWLQPAGV
jgi:hypothetical protein